MNLAVLYATLPTQDDLILRAAKSMKLFERDGLIHYGKWAEWRRAAPDDARRLLVEFRGGQR